MRKSASWWTTWPRACTPPTASAWRRCRSGCTKRVIVIDLDQKEGKKNPRAFINPKILWASEETAVFEEGCLSVPEIWDDVERPARIKAEYLDRDGKQADAGSRWDAGHLPAA